MRRPPKKSYRLLHRLLDGNGQRPFRPVSAFAHYVGRLCEEFPALKPSDVLAERARLPEGFLEEIIESRAYARALATNQGDPDANGWRSSPIRTLAREIEHELAEEEIAARHGR